MPKRRTSFLRGDNVIYNHLLCTIVMIEEYNNRKWYILKHKNSIYYNIQDKEISPCTDGFLFHVVKQELLRG